MTLHALLFTDIVDSTVRVASLGDAAAAAMWAEHDRLARELLARHDGREIDRSDGFFLLFDDIAAAAAFARGLHAALEPLELRARAGLHVGEVTLRTNPPEAVARGAKPLEVEGLAKPVAARVMSVARGGQTLLSGDAAAALKDRLPAGTVLHGHGHWRLKGLADPVELAELGHEGGFFEPPPDGDKAYRVVRDGDLWTPRREIRHNLAPERDAFVGRSAELAELVRRLEEGQRLVTVLGVGGTGKTRLVRRYGRAWLGEWPGGVHFCDLSEARSLEGICYAVATALDVPLGKDDPVLQLGHAIGGRGRCLVILDNFEQVVEHASATVGRWLDRAVDASFIVTSRERLQLAGEAVYAVEPLRLDDEGVELFEARAKVQRADVDLSGPMRTIVAEIVKLLDGLPLAIELAAARMRVLSPTQILQRLSDRFALLAGARGAAARQATLRAAIDWSWDLLQPWEQSALAQCAAFEGGFTLEAAEAVIELSVWAQAPAVMDVVQSLVDKSLLRLMASAQGARLDVAEPYFGMYLSVREYAAMQLQREGAPAVALAHGRHGRYFARFGSDEAIRALDGADALARRGALRLELDNVMAACTRAVACGDVDVAVHTFSAAWAVFDLTGPLGQALAIAPRIVALPGMAPEQRARALMNHGWVSLRAGHLAEANASFEQALQLFQPLTERAGERWQYVRTLVTQVLLLHESGENERVKDSIDRALAEAVALGDRPLQGTALNNAALHAWRHGRLDLACDQWQAAVAIHTETGDQRSLGISIGNLAMVSHERGRYDEAVVLYERALQLHRASGNRRLEGMAQGNLGCLHAEQRAWDQARACFGRCLLIAREVGDRRIEGVLLGNMGCLSFDQGQLAAAIPQLESALAINREVGNRPDEGAALGTLGEVLFEQGRLTESRETLRAAERVLREVRHRLPLATVLCVRGRLDVLQHDLDSARAALDEVRETAAALGVDDASRLGRTIVELESSLAQ